MYYYYDEFVLTAVRLRGFLTKTHLAFFAVVLVMFGVVYFLVVVVVQLVAVPCRNANLPDEAVPLLLVHQSYVLNQGRDPSQPFSNAYLKHVQSTPRDHNKRLMFIHIFEPR